MNDAATIAPLTTLVTFGFVGLIVGGLILYLALIGRKAKK